MTLTLGALLRQDMTTMGLGPLEVAGTALAKALRGTTIGFDLWHFRSPLVVQPWAGGLLIQQPRQCHHARLLLGHRVAGLLFAALVLNACAGRQP
jgi:hypothetical protein